MYQSISLYSRIAKCNTHCMFESVCQEVRHSVSVLCLYYSHQSGGLQVPSWLPHFSLSLSACLPSPSSLSYFFLHTCFYLFSSTSSTKWSPAKLNSIWIHLISLLFTHFLAGTAVNKNRNWREERNNLEASSVSTHTCLIPNTASQSTARTLYRSVPGKSNLWVRLF